MTLFNELWKKFKKPPPSTRDGREQSLGKTMEATPVPPKILLKSLQDHETEYLQRKEVLANVKALKALIDIPKEQSLELRFANIKRYLGNPECYETVRQERWPDDIQCPNCHSTHLKRLPQLPPQPLHNHRYCCLDCHTEFNDDSGTPLEKGLPPLNIWMQCWYLIGCTGSLSYIATKLNLDLSVVEMMVRQLQKIFKAEQPLTRYVEYKEWNEQSQNLRKQLKEDLLKQYEVLDANTANTPKDTAEYRRQSTI